LLILIALLITGIAQGQVTGHTGAEDPVRSGAQDAATKIEVFVDYQCPSRANFYPHLKAVEGRYGKTTQIIYRHFLISFHDKARIAAQAVEAARAQVKALEMIDKWTRNYLHRST
jgi:protein-disulfide isomerase